MPQLLGQDQQPAARRLLIAADQPRPERLHGVQRSLQVAGLVVAAMFEATCNEPARSAHVLSAQTIVVSAATATTASSSRGLCWPAATSRTAIVPRTATAANPHAPNPTPSAESPAASTIAAGRTPSARPHSQRPFNVTRAPRPARIIDSATISLTEATSSYPYTSAGTVAVRAASAAHPQ